MEQELDLRGHMAPLQAQLEQQQQQVLQVGLDICACLCPEVHCCAGLKRGWRSRVEHWYLQTALQHIPCDRVLLLTICIEIDLCEPSSVTKS